MDPVVQPPLIDVQPVALLSILQVATTVQQLAVSVRPVPLAGTPLIDVQPVALPTQLVVM